MTEEKTIYNVTEAQAAVNADRQRRSAQCAAEIQQVLKRYGCQIVAQPTLTPDGRIVAQIQIIAQ